MGQFRGQGVRDGLTAPQELEGDPRSEVKFWTEQIIFLAEKDGVGH